MTIIELQRRIAEIGRIRIGQQIKANGKTRPAKLETFRLTSADKQRIECAAEIFGGTPRQWDAPAGKQWEVVTTTDALTVIVPPSDIAFSQFYELWSAGGCQRRCDGQSESISDGPCLCDPDDRQCDIHSRLSVMIADLPGLGVWRIDTSGYYAAVELQGAVEVIRIAAGRGEMLPARLRLEQRSVKRPGANGRPETRRFAVPVLDIEISPGELFAGVRPPSIANGARLELESGRPALTPVPETVPRAPVGTVAEQAAKVTTATRKPRQNAAQPLPSTGLAPRTTAQAESQGARPVETLPLEVEAITEPQMKWLQAHYKDVDRVDRLAEASGILGRDIDSFSSLSKADASRLIDDIERHGQELDKAAEGLFPGGES